MIIFNRFGLFSVVRHDSGEGKVAVRARVRDHLVRLLRAAGIASLVLASPRRDYPHRTVLSLSEWMRLNDFVGRLAASTVNVKDSVAAEHGHESATYRLAVDLWVLGLNLQRTVEGPSQGARTSKSTRERVRADPSNGRNTTPRRGSGTHRPE